MRRAFFVSLIALILSAGATPAWACGAMVSEEGATELREFQALLSFDGETEDLLVTIDYGLDDEYGDYSGKAEDFAWLMPFPSPPEVSEGSYDGLDAALEMTEAPDRRDHVPAVLPFVCACGGASEDAAGEAAVLDRTVVGSLEFVTLGGDSGSEVTTWMRRHGFNFHDKQQPVIDSYLAKDWVIVAARPTEEAGPEGRLTPVRFNFATDEAIYPLAIAQTDHGAPDLRASLLLVTPEKPASETFDIQETKPDDDGYFPDPSGFELRYSAPLDQDAARRIQDSVDADAGAWLSRVEASIPTQNLDEDLILTAAGNADPLEFGYLLEKYDNAKWGARAGQVFFTALILAPPILLILGVVWIIKKITRAIRN